MAARMAKLEHQLAAIHLAAQPQMPPRASVLEAQVLEPSYNAPEPSFDALEPSSDAPEPLYEVSNHPRQVLRSSDNISDPSTSKQISEPFHGDSQTPPVPKTLVEVLQPFTDVVESPTYSTAHFMSSNSLPVTPYSRQQFTSHCWSPI